MVYLSTALKKTWFPFLADLTIGGEFRLDPAQKYRCLSGMGWNTF